MMENIKDNRSFPDLPSNKLLFPTILQTKREDGMNFPIHFIVLGERSKHIKVIRSQRIPALLTDIIPISLFFLHRSWQYLSCTIVSLGEACEGSLPFLSLIVCLI